MRIFLLLILSVYGLASASATEKVINYDDFVHLSFPSQVEAIKLVHSFLIEYEHQVHFQKISKRKTSQYKVYQKIMGHFISSAHADDSALFNQVPENLKCYYGGWISYMKPSTSGKSYCVHPKDMGLSSNQNYLAKAAKFTSKTDPKFKESPIYKFYIGKVSSKYNDYFTKGAIPITNVGFDQDTNTIVLSEGTSTCSSNSSKSSITCNPDIYGLYKGSALCIKSKRAYGVNSSFLCSKALEHINETEPTVYKETMRGIIDNGISSQSELFNTLKAMYDTCLCGGDASSSSPVYFQNSISPDYASRIFKSRTCAGILSQTQLINEAFILSCNENSSKFNNKKQRDWIKFLNKTSSALQQKIDDLRSKRPTKLGSKKLNRANIQRLFSEDERLFGEIAANNFEIAKEHNLCPIMKSKPELLATYDEVNKVLTVVPEGDAAKIDIKNLEIKHTQNTPGQEAASSVLQNEATRDTQRSASATTAYIYDVTPAPKESKAQAFATYNGQPIESNIVSIQGITIEKPGLSLIYSEGGQVKLTIIGVKKSEKSKYTASEPATDETVDENFWQGGDLPSIALADGQVQNGHERLYNVSQVGQDYKLTSNLMMEGATEPVATAEVTIPAGDGNKLMLKSISYKIQDEKLYNIVGLNLTIKGEEDKANEAIEFDKLSLLPTGSALVKLESLTNYVLKTPSDPIELKATFTKDADTPPIISNPEKFGPPDLACKMEKKEDGEAMIITFIPSFKEGVSLEEFDITKPENMSDLKVLYNEKDVSSLEGETNKVKIKSFDPEMPLTATAQIKIADVSTTLVCGESDEKEEIASKTEETSELASCKIEIINKKDDNGKFNLSHKVSYLDSNGGDLPSPPEGLKTTIVWYDHSAKAGEKKDKKSSSRTMASEDEDEDEDGVKEDRKGKKDKEDSDDSDDSKNSEDSLIEEVQNLEDKFRKVKGNAKGNTMSITQTAKDRKFSISVIAESPYKDKCQASTSYTVKKKSIKVPNNSENFLQGPNTNMVRPSGSFMGGQR